MIVWGEIGFESPRQFAAGEQYAPPTAFTFEANIRAEADDGPFV